MQYQYRPSGVCSRQITIDVENGVVQNVSFVGGCNGNLQGIGALVKGMKIEDVIARLEHIRCNGKPTSCPDQLAQALKKIQAETACTRKNPLFVKILRAADFFIKLQLKSRWYYRHRQHPLLVA